MQSAYAFLQSKSDNLNTEEIFLFTSIDKMYDLYALIIRLFVEVKNMEKKETKKLGSSSSTRCNSAAPLYNYVTTNVASITVVWSTA